MSGVVMPTLRVATPRLRAVLGYGRNWFQSGGRAIRWTVFMAGLWSEHRIWHAVRRAALVMTLAGLPACSELAQSDTIPPAQPPYVSLAAKYFQSAMKDRASFDAFEISAPRWVHSIKGWSWLSCVHFQDRGHVRNYAIFIQDSTVVDGRYAV
jgi:hypothetical protein